MVHQLRVSFGRFTPVLVALLFALSTAAGALAQDDDPPPLAGRMSYLAGNVSVQPAGTQDWGQAYPNLPVGPGDRIFTDVDGRAEIQVGQSFVRVGPNSDITLIQADPYSITFGLAQGSAHIRILGLWPQQSLYVQTPSGSTTVSQPGDLRVDAYPDQQAAVFTNYFGVLYISGAGDFGLETGSGQALELVGSNPVYPEWLQPAYPDALDNFSRMRDEQIARAASYQYVSQEVPGAYELDASGQWMPNTEYGAIWFPNVAVDWQPYHNGHWINRQPWGWVWVEDEPWGYAPFHYGRWVNYHGRWGWLPGPPAAHPVWSPALVVFAGGIQFGGGGVSAWFPLGPGEPYQPWYPCSPAYVNQVNITNIGPSRMVQVQRTYININITNITYVNRTVGVTAVSQADFASGRPVSQAAVRISQAQMASVRVVPHPPAVAPTPQAAVGRTPARPVPVSAARPALINASGALVTATPHAVPMAAPVRQVSAPHPLPGRTAVPAPRNVQMVPPSARPMKPGAPPPAPAPARQPQPMQQAQPFRSPSPQPAQPAVAQPRPMQPGVPAQQNGQQPRPAMQNPAPSPAYAPAARPAAPAEESPSRPMPRPSAPEPSAKPPAPARPAPEARPAPAPPAKNQAKPAQDKNKDKDKKKEDQKPQ